MTDWKDKIKNAALKAGTAAQKDPRLMKAALNVKDAVDAFKQGYREQMEPEKYKAKCPHCDGELPEKANFCPKCGAKID
jgi:Zn finger protein HypA/HybF involved in hydrogenase expression